MKYIIAFWGLLFYLGLSGNAASSPEQLLKKAQSLYDNEQYAKAAETYTRILKRGYVAPEIYYNIGNCYFKNNQITEAIYFYEKALKLAPNDKDIRYNLSLANQYTTDKIKHLTPFWLTHFINRFFALHTADTWAFISTFSFYVFLGLVLLFLFLHRLLFKQILLWLSVFALLVSLVSLWGALHQYHIETDKTQAILFAPTVNIKSSPSENGTNLMIVHEGLKVTIEDSVNNWYKISLPDGNEGWLEKTTLKRI